MLSSHRKAIIAIALLAPLLGSVAPAVVAIASMDPPKDEPQERSLPDVVTELLTQEQVDAMSEQEARAALGKVAKARQQRELDRDILRQNFGLLLRRLRSFPEANVTPPPDRSDDASADGPSQTLKIGSEDDDRFGCDIDISGDSAIIGAADAAYIYNLDGSNWRFGTKLGGEDTPMNGIVSVSIDGDRCAVGVGRGTAERPGGVAYVFRRQDADWILDGTLVAPDVAENAFFGIDISIDGARCIVGASRDDGTGAAYIYRRGDDRWVLDTKLLAAPQYADKYFGKYVTLYGDTCASGGLGGSVDVYGVRDGKWALERRLSPANIEGRPRFGAIGSDENVVVTVGVVDSVRGVATVFGRADEWRHEQTLSCGEVGRATTLISSIALGHEHMVVGTMGAATLFRKKDAVWGEWPIRFAAPGGRAEPMFGSAVACGERQIMVGAPRRTGGAVYIWSLDGRDVPDPISKEAIAAMTPPELRQAVKQIVEIRRRLPEGNKELEQRLQEDWRRLMTRLRELSTAPDRDP